MRRPSARRSSIGSRGNLGYLRDLALRGLLVANGPLADQTDQRFRGISIYALPLVEALELARAARPQRDNARQHPPDAGREVRDGP